MSSKISELTELNASLLGDNDFVTVANTSLNTNYKVKLANLFSVSLSTPATESFSFIGSVSSSGTIVQKGLVSQSDIITLSETGNLPIDKVINIDVDLSAVDLSLCDNTNSSFLVAADVSQFLVADDVSSFLTAEDVTQFLTADDVTQFLTADDISLFLTADDLTGYLTSVDLTSDVTEILPIANGGLGSAGFVDKAVIVSQDAGTTALQAKTLDTPGEILIGGANGPETGTLTAGNNITIVNGDNSIQINSFFNTAVSDINMNGYNIELADGWINYDGDTAQGITFNSSNNVYIGPSSTAFFDDTLNIGGDVKFKADSNISIAVDDGSNPGTLSILGADSTDSNGDGGDVRIVAGAGGSNANGGDATVEAGLGSAQNGKIYLRTGGINSVIVDDNGDTTVRGDITINGGDVETVESGSGLKVPYEAVQQVGNITSSVSLAESSGIIVLYGESIAAGAIKEFTVSSPLVTGTCKILVTVVAPSNEGSVGSFVVAQVYNRITGSFKVRLANLASADTSANSHILHYLIVK
jgi:hypothetical protein